MTFNELCHSIYANAERRKPLRETRHELQTGITYVVEVIEATADGRWEMTVRDDYEQQYAVECDFCSPR